MDVSSEKGIYENLIKAINAVEDAIYIKDLDGHYIYVNKTDAHFIGFSEGKIRRIHSENALRSAVLFQQLSNIDTLTDISNHRGFEEEFVVLLSSSNEKTTETACERLRKSVAEQIIPYKEQGQTKHVTISIGVVVSSPERQQSAKEIINIADQALYEAKEKGRNCCVLSMA